MFSTYKPDTFFNPEKHYLSFDAEDEARITEISEGINRLLAGSKGDKPMAEIHRAEAIARTLGQWLVELNQSNGPTYGSIDKDIRRACRRVAEVTKILCPRSVDLLPTRLHWLSGLPATKGAFGREG